MNDPKDDLVRKNARTGLYVLAGVIFMVGVAFASVPLYNLFCRMTGFDGTTLTAAQLPDKILDREVTVAFNADTGRNMPWDFKPDLGHIKVKLGEKGLVTFKARNKLGKSTAGTALYNVTPPKAGRYFHKIQCFCFDRQVLEPSQEAHMPVVFFIDPAMNDDPNMNDVQNITLSYTFFEADSKELEQAMEGFYNGETPDIKGSN
jgi:cytochrome c oxidase assembly protein subunit 11